MSMATVGKGPRSIFYVSLAVRLFSIQALVLCSELQQAFDTSHVLLSYALDPQNRHGLLAGPAKWLLALVKWDTVYFLSLASPGSTTELAQQHAGGYHFEQSLAFQPGIVYLLRWTGYVTPSLDGEWSPVSALLLTTLLANVATLLSPLLLYRLTCQLTLRNDLAYTTALLSILATTAGTTLTCPTPEPFFSFAALAGLVSLEQKRGSFALIKAALWFAVATLFRANGVLLTGFLAWKLCFHPRPSTSSLLQRSCTRLGTFVLLALVAVSPFALFQQWAATRLCQEGRGATVPCNATLPNVYGYIQSTYWNVGLFRYWELAQLPNFALAMPVLLLLGRGVWVYFSRSTMSEIAQTVRPFRTASHRSSSASSSASSSELTLASTPSLTPYVLHSLVVGSVLLVASHVQIALRFASPGGLPLVWWSAASLTHSGSQTRNVIITYLSVHYVVAMVLYAGFYPPA